MQLISRFNSSLIRSTSGSMKNFTRVPQNVFCAWLKMNESSKQGETG